MSTFDPSKYSFNLLPQYGVDVNKYINNRMKSMDMAVARVKQQEADYQSRISSIGKLKEGITTFQTASKTLMDRNNLSAVQSSSSASEYVSITNTSSAKPLDMSIQVRKLAQQHKLTSAKFDDTKAAMSGINPGILTIDFGTIKKNLDSSIPPAVTSATFIPSSKRESAQISIPPNSSLEDIRNIINKGAPLGTADWGVTASIIGGALVLTSKETGEISSMKVSVSNFESGSMIEGLAFDPTQSVVWNPTYSGMRETMAGQDAELIIDGSFVKQSSNEIKDLVAGATITLNKVHDTSKDPDISAKLKITVNTDGTKKAVEDFLKAYNTFNKTIEELSQRENLEAEKAEGPLAKELVLIRQIKNSIRNSMFASFDTGDDKVKSLFDLGIKTDKGGNMSIKDTKRFETLMKESPDAVINLFNFNSSGNEGFNLINSGDKIQNGNYTVDITQQLNAVLQSSIVFTVPATPSAGGPSGGNFEITVNNGQKIRVDLNAFSSTATNKNSYLKDLQDYINNYTDSSLSPPTNLVQQGNAVSIGLNSNGEMYIKSQKTGEKSYLSLDVSGSPLLQQLGLNGINSSQGSNNISGTIGGYPATGDGTQLTGGVGTPIEGLVIDISSGNTGNIGSLNFSKGLSFMLNENLEKFIETKTKGGLLEVRKDQLTEAKKQTSTRLSKLRDRSDRTEEKIYKELQQQEIALAKMQQAQQQMQAQLGGGFF